MALSNMPVRSTTTDMNTNMRWTHFHQTPVMPTYLIAIMLSKFRVPPIDENFRTYRARTELRIPLKEINFRYHTLQSKLHAKYAIKVIEDVTLYFDNKWMYFEVPKVDHVSIPNYLHDGMGNLGLVSYR